MRLPPAPAQPILRYVSLLATFLCLATLSPTAHAATLYPVPAEVASSHFRVAIDGHATDTLHAATGYYLLNFDTDGPVRVTVTAEDPHFWDSGVEVQPMRLGIRPTRKGATISFTMPGPSKLTITRPGDHFADAEILFLFANPVDHYALSHFSAASPNIRYYGPGAHHENIDARSGDTIYLAGGAVLFGSINIWQVDNVRILGTGTVIYDGPQNPHADKGWMHKPNWHCMVMDNAHNIEVDGITCITRSRSWQIQMKDSRHIGFYNIKVIGGNPNNANQDGMDWLGGGDTTVRNSFFRASDDVFAVQGNWDGYDLALMRIPGHDVTNITIEDTIASTSISNTIRVAWPQKTFNSAHFHMSNMDVIHTGFGACKVPFAFFELWADPEGKGHHSDYRFRDIRLEDWYALYNIDQPNADVRDVAFSEVWAMDSPAMVPSILKGDISGVSEQGTTDQGFTGSAPQVSDGAAQPTVAPAAINAHFSYTAGLLHAHQPIAFTADHPDAEGFSFEWLFGDGTRAEGRAVHHTFPDAEGTLLDGSGRFRVLLHITHTNGSQSWGSQQVVLAAKPPNPKTAPISTTAQTENHIFDRTVHIPADGGYTFTLLTSTAATLSIDDGAPLHTPRPRPQVCGAEGDAVQPVRLSVALTAGDHHIRIARDNALENAVLAASTPTDHPLLLWEGPGIDRQPIPQTAYSQ
jgi:hypothetical protein